MKQRPSGSTAPAIGMIVGLRATCGSSSKNAPI
jgi:hypothetical protein